MTMTTEQTTRSTAAAHTPGPWQAGTETKGDGGYVYANGAPVGERLIAITYGSDYEANARLIASAPALLAALEDAVRMLKAWDKEYGSQTTDIARLQSLINQASS